MVNIEVNLSKIELCIPIQEKRVSKKSAQGQK